MMISIDFPRILPPTSSTAMRAASTDVLPPKSAYGPDWSLRIPIRTTPLGLCASATLLRNSPMQNRLMKDEYRIDPSQKAVQYWHISPRSVSRGADVTETQVGRVLCGELVLPLQAGQPVLGIGRHPRVCRLQIDPI